STATVTAFIWISLALFIVVIAAIVRARGSVHHVASPEEEKARVDVERGSPLGLRQHALQAHGWVASKIRVISSSEAAPQVDKGAVCRRARLPEVQPTCLEGEPAAPQGRRALAWLVDLAIVGLV